MPTSSGLFIVPDIPVSGEYLCVIRFDVEKSEQEKQKSLQTINCYEVLPSWMKSE
jgi:hypothetical protein